MIDEINDYERYTAHTFVDFLEALGRLADIKALPSGEELQEFGFPNVYSWCVRPASAAVPRRREPLRRDRYYVCGSRAVKPGSPSAGVTLRTSRARELGDLCSAV